MFERLRSSLSEKRALIGVAGLGYVGLPLVQTLVDAGYRTLGFDIDERKTRSILMGLSYLDSISSDWIAEKRCRELLSATSDMERFAEADAILICVPTPLAEHRDPDLSHVISTVEKIAAVLRPGQLIVLESTSYPGTTRDVVLPILLKSGLKPGEDFFLAYSPEREDPGNGSFCTAEIPKVLGAIDAQSLELAHTLYGGAFKRVVPVSSCETAEACKILENTYRAVNIALVNELKMLYQRMGIDIWEVIAAAETKPFGFQAFYPGPGLGGHCIPIDPFYLTWAARKYGLNTRFIELAGEINASMPEFVTGRLAAALNERSKPVRGAKILILGMAYKRDVADPRESPGFELLKLLRAQEASVAYHDPLIPKLPPMRRYPALEMDAVPITAETLAEQDCVLIAVDHSAYDWEFIVRHSKLVIDTRNATKRVELGREKIVKC